jgi:hypothetical protein
VRREDLSLISPRCSCGDDPPDTGSIGPNDRNDAFGDPTGDPTEADHPNLVVPVRLGCQMRTVEDADRVAEIDAVLLKIDGSLALVPGKPITRHVLAQKRIGVDTDVYTATGLAGRMRVRAFALR